MRMIIINRNADLTSNTVAYKFVHMKTTIAERLAAAMAAAGNNISQDDLARLSGVSQPTINRLLKGAAKGSAKIVEIANALDVNPAWLSRGEGDMKGSVSERIEADTPLFSRVPLWDGKGKTERFVLVPKGKATSTWRAYELERNSGIQEGTAGSILYIDTSVKPENGDLVVASIQNQPSLYRFLDGGTAGFLTVDDPRIPIVDISSSAELIGTLLFLLSDKSR